METDNQEEHNFNDFMDNRDDESGQEAALGGGVIGGQENLGNQVGEQNSDPKIIENEENDISSQDFDLDEDEDGFREDSIDEIIENEETQNTEPEIPSNVQEGEPISQTNTKKESQDDSTITNTQEATFSDDEAFVCVENMESSNSSSRNSIKNKRQGPEFQAVGNEVDASTIEASNLDFWANNITQIRQIVLCQQMVDNKSSFLDQHKAFRFSITMPNKETFQPLRRFSDFTKLHSYLVNQYSYSIIPHLPEKSPLSNFQGDAFFEERKTDLELFLYKLVNHSTVVNDEKFLEFISSNKFDVAVGSSKLLNLTSNISESTGKAKSFFQSIWKRPSPQKRSGQPLQVSKEEDGLSWNIEELSKLEKEMETVMANIEEVIQRVDERAEATQGQKDVFNQMLLQALQQEDVQLQNYYGIDAGTIEQFKLVQQEVSKENFNTKKSLHYQVRIFIKDIYFDLIETIKRSNKALIETSKLRKKISEDEEKNRQNSMGVYSNHLKQIEFFNEELKEFNCKIILKIKELMARFFGIMNKSNSCEKQYWSKIDISTLKQPTKQCQNTIHQKVMISKFRFFRNFASQPDRLPLPTFIKETKELLTYLKCPITQKSLKFDEKKLELYSIIYTESTNQKQRVVYPIKNQVVDLTSLNASIHPVDQQKIQVI